METEIFTQPCPTHPSERSVAYCVECRTLLCKNCAASHPSDHETIARFPTLSRARAGALLQSLSQLKLPSREVVLRRYIEAASLVQQACVFKDEKKYSAAAESLIGATRCVRQGSTALGSIQERVSLWTEEGLVWFLQRAESFTRIQLKIKELCKYDPAPSKAHCFSGASGVLTVFDGKTKVLKMVQTQLQPTSRGIDRFDTIQVRDKVYVCSKGPEGVPPAFSIDSQTGKIKNLASPCYLKENPALANLVDRYIVSVGGVLGGHTSKCEMFDTVTGTWHKFPKILRGLDWVSTLVFNQRFIYSVGGCDGSGGSKWLQVIDALDQEAEWDFVNYRIEGAKFYTCDSGTVQDSNISGMIFGSYAVKSLNLRLFFYGNGLLRIQPDFPFQDHFRQRKSVMVKGCVYEFTFGTHQLAKKCVLSDGPWMYDERTIKKQME